MQVLKTNKSTNMSKVFTIVKLRMLSKWKHVIYRTCHERTHIRCVHSFDQSGLYEAPISSALSRRVDRSGFSKPLRTNTTFFISVWMDCVEDASVSSASHVNTFKIITNQPQYLCPVSTGPHTQSQINSIKFFEKTTLLHYDTDTLTVLWNVWHTHTQTHTHTHV